MFDRVLNTPLDQAAKATVIVSLVHRFADEGGNFQNSKLHNAIKVFPIYMDFHNTLINALKDVTVKINTATNTNTATGNIK